MVIALMLSLATFALVDVVMRRTGEISGARRRRPARPRRDGPDDAPAALAGVRPAQRRRRGPSRSLVVGVGDVGHVFADFADPSTDGRRADPARPSRPIASGQLTSRRHHGRAGRSPSDAARHAVDDGRSCRRRPRQLADVAPAADPRRHAHATTASRRPAMRRCTRGTRRAADARADVVPLATPEDSSGREDQRRADRDRLPHQATRLPEHRASHVFQNEIYVRTADPNARR